MWRWIIRVYVAFIVFFVMMFISGVVLINANHLLVWANVANLSNFIHAHILLTMFLLGLVAGQVYLGSNFTGRGWFRSKSGMTYEGFKLETLKPWSWLIISPVLFAGLIFWFEIQKENGVFAQINWLNFYHGFLLPESPCYLHELGKNRSCGLNFMFLGTWIAAIGYSLAPYLRTGIKKVIFSLRA